MTREDWKDLRTLEILALSISFAWSFLTAYACYSSLTPHGTSGGADMLSFVGVLGFLCFVLAGGLSLILLAFKRSKKIGLGLLFFSLTVIVCFVVTTRVCGHMRHQALVRLTERSKPLIAALKAYQAEQGTPPTELKNLVPKYYKEEPRTGIGIYPEYKYFSGKDAVENYDGNPWVLMVFTPETLMDFDHMLYLPNQNYHDYQRTRWGMIGDWQYLDD